MQLKPIADQVVVLMGASSGIGREAAKRFATRGARVVVSARGVEGLETLVAEIRSSGGVATAVPPTRPMPPPWRRSPTRRSPSTAAWTAGSSSPAWGCGRRSRTRRSTSSAA